MSLFKRHSATEPDSEYFLHSYLRLMQTHPITTENFLDSFAQLGNIFEAESGSLYLYESKANVFVLKKSFGTSPDRLSISGDYEFLSYLKSREGPVFRDEFVKNATHDMRQPALIYFQNTHASLCYPILSEGEWCGLINLDVFDDKEESKLSILLGLYGDALARWLTYQSTAEQNRKLSEVAHVKDQLISNVTHELHTPLNGALGGCDVLLAHPNLDTDQKQSVLMIQKSTRELQRTIDQILSLVQIESKQTQLSREKVDLSTLVYEVSALYTDVCQPKGVVLHVPSASESISVYANADQMRAVFMNLIGNAVKYTEAGFVRVGFEKVADWIYVSIADSGIGIDEDKQHLIFEEFYQVDGSHTRVYGGTGLGLAIVKKIITLHGGKIWVESQKGAGAQFKLTLPVYPV